MSATWLGWLRSKRALIARIGNLNAESVALVQAATAMRAGYRREYERQRRRIHALTEENAALRQVVTNHERERGRANVVDAFRRGAVNPPLGVRPKALTDAQRELAAEDAMWKRYDDGLADQ